MKNIDRRNFLQSAGLLGGAAAIGSFRSISAPVGIGGSETEPHFSILLSSSGEAIVRSSMHVVIGSFDALEPLPSPERTALDSAGGLGLDQALAGIPPALIPISTLPLLTWKGNLDLEELIIEVQVEEGPAARFPGLIPSPVPEPEAIKIGVYYIHLAAHTHVIQSCIKRNVPHVNIEIRKEVSAYRPKLLIVNLHLAAWIENTVTCLGIYEPRTNYCRKACLDLSWGAVAGFLYAALRGYFSSAQAWTFAKAIAGPVIAILMIVP